MFHSRLARWSYDLGCITTVAAIVYRLFWLGTLGAHLFGAAPRVIPHNFLDLSILLFVLSIASNTQAMGYLDERKATAASKGE